MFTRIGLFITGSLAAAVLLVCGPESKARIETEGVEVLGKAPVHEAFAEPGQTQQQAPKVITKEPPNLIEEARPEEKPEGDNVQWFGGYWFFDEERDNFIWITGVYRAVPPGRRFVPGAWQEVEGGWQRTNGFWAPDDQEQMTYLPPPPDPVEVAQTSPPSEDSTFVPPCWVWRESRYVLRAGFWIDYRPGWVWVPAHYVWTPAGWIFVEGYWDVVARGLLFAPVYIEAHLLRPGWIFTPSYVVAWDFLPTALFVSPCGFYVFGDYFGADYLALGYKPWLDVRFGRFGFDPLFAYYRHHHRGDRLWEKELRELYVGRHKGTLALPPKTLNQQLTVVNHITTNKLQGNLKHLTVLQTLGQVDRKQIPLVKVTREEKDRQVKLALLEKETLEKRRHLEKKLVLEGHATLKKTDTPLTVKLDLPKITTTVKLGDKVPALPAQVRTDSLKLGDKVKKFDLSDGKPLIQGGDKPKDKPLDVHKDRPLDVVKDKLPIGPKDKPLDSLKDKPLDHLKDKPLGGPKDKPLDIHKDKPVDVLKDKPLDSLKDKLPTGPKDRPLDSFRDRLPTGPKDRPTGPKDKPLGFSPDGTPAGHRDRKK
jgi:hypothetical protein